jgi:hypothetical protein
MITDIEYDEDLLNEVSEGIRAHWDGLCLYAAPDVMFVNVAKEAIWSRMAVLSGLTAANVLHPRQLLNLGDGPLPDKVAVPQPRLPCEIQEELSSVKRNRNSKSGYSP